MAEDSGVKEQFKQFSFEALNEWLAVKGFVIVPIEPTVEMVKAGWNSGPYREPVHEEIWKAMIEARPR